MQELEVTSELRLAKIEEKVNALEKAIEEITQQTKQVLMDTRTILSELDNPLNYLRSLGLDEVTLGMVEDKIKEITDKELKKFREEIKALATQQEKLQKEQDEQTTYELKANSSPEVLNTRQHTQVQQNQNIDETISLIVCTGYLLYTFGKKALEKVLDDYAKRGWISDEVKLSITRVASIMDSTSFPDEREVGIEDHIIATYLLDKLTKGGNSIDFMVILLLLGKYADFSFKAQNR